jgi:hypothetical protein
MPIYLFEHPKTKKLKEVNQAMNDKHQYIDEDGIRWLRVFSSPNSSIKGTKLDFRNKKDLEKWETVYKKRYNHNKK